MTGFSVRDLEIADVTVDTGHRTVRRAGKIVPLTRLEYDIFEILASQVDRTVTRETLIELIWQDWQNLGSNKLDVAIRSIRKKMDSGA